MPTITGPVSQGEESSEKILAVNDSSKAYTLEHHLVSHSSSYYEEMHPLD